MQQPLLLLALAGCSSSLAVSYSQTNRSPHPIEPRAIETVDVLTLPPGRAYVEVGMLTVTRSGYSATRTNDLFVAELRRVAARHGCDAVVVPRQNAYGRLEVNAPCLVYTTR